VFATLVAWGVTRHSDRTGERAFHICIPLAFGILGFVIAISTMNTAARYVSLFLMAQSYRYDALPADTSQRNALT
jgi:hypothetical protein